MARWFIEMTFTGYVEADSASLATKAFKAELGLAPESMRSDSRMTHLRVRSFEDPPTPWSAEPKPDE